jgi:ribonuclease Z
VDAVESELRVAGLTLRGVSVGGTKTCLQVPEVGVMFDVAPDVHGQMRYDTILVSHGHQDHLGGLPYLVSQRHMVKGGPPAVHVPREIHDPLERIFQGWREIEDFALQVKIVPHDPGDRVRIDAQHEAVCVRSVHRVPSLAWIVERTSHRLLPAYEGRPGPELAELRKAGTRITEPHTEPLLCVTGDTQIELFHREPIVRRARVLVYEVTGWDERRSAEDVRKWGHTHVDEMIACCEAFEGDALVLVHRSPRHSRRQAESIVRERFPAAVRSKVHVFGP